MSKFEVIRGVEGYCLSLDDSRIAGPKPWGGGEVIQVWETDKVYKPERTCHIIEDGYMDGHAACSYCGTNYKCWGNFVEQAPEWWWDVLTDRQEKKHTEDERTLF